MPALTKDGVIWTITMDDGENRFTPEFLDQMHTHMAEISANAEPAALLTVGSGKFYSNGLDLEWLGAHEDKFGWYVDQIHSMFATMVALPVPTIAAVSGHAFGGGAMLAMCHDFRVMREDRGYFCLPEADIQIPFTEGMNALLQAKLTPQAQVAAMTTGARFGAADALAYGIVDAIAPEADVVTSAASRVSGLAGKHRPTLSTIKQRLYASAVAALGTSTEH